MQRRGRRRRCGRAACRLSRSALPRVDHLPERSGCRARASPLSIGTADRPSSGGRAFRVLTGSSAMRAAWRRAACGRRQTCRRCGQVLHGAIARRYCTGQGPLRRVHATTCTTQVQPCTCPGAQASVAPLDAGIRSPRGVWSAECSSCLRYGTRVAHVYAMKTYISFWLMGARVRVIARSTYTRMCPPRFPLVGLATHIIASLQDAAYRTRGAVPRRTRAGRSASGGGRVRERHVCLRSGFAWMLRCATRAILIARECARGAHTSFMPLFVALAASAARRVPVCRVHTPD